MALPTTIPPLGMYPGGYHIVDFSERLTNSGPEASITFEGPSTKRWDLIYTFFTKWILDDPSGCFEDPVFWPKPYPDLAGAVRGETFFTCGDSNLYADTFTVQRAGQTCTPDAVDCETGSYALIERPLYASGGSDNECVSQVTINFRRKNTEFPLSYFSKRDLFDDLLWSSPDIPTGTYVEVTINPTVQARTLEKRRLEYVAAYNSYKFLNGAPGTCTTDTPSPLLTPEFCTSGTSTAVSEDLSTGSYIFTEEVEVTWCGVPDPKWDEIRPMQGRVNGEPWLGYPSGGVLLASAKPIEKGFFGNITLYDIVFTFEAMTAPVEIPAGSTHTAETLASVGVYNERIGLWNRIWSNDPIRLDPGPGTGICTNWVLVESPGAPSCGCYVNGKSFIHPHACFNDLFSIDFCPPPSP